MVKEHPPADLSWFAVTRTSQTYTRNADRRKPYVLPLPTDEFFVTWCLSFYSGEYVGGGWVLVREAQCKHQSVVLCPNHPERISIINSWSVV